jgi:hypothetical protein
MTLGTVAAFGCSCVFVDFLTSLGGHRHEDWTGCDRVAGAASVRWLCVAGESGFAQGLRRDREC